MLRISQIYVAAYYNAVICVCQEFFIAALYVLDYTSVALACNIGVTITWGDK